MKLKKFNVSINVDTTYYAEDKEDCERLVIKDFPNLEISDELDINEV